jgi:hypothetical protein
MIDRPINHGRSSDQDRLIRSIDHSIDR